jgi:hypothetical protein
MSERQGGYARSYLSCRRLDLHDPAPPLVLGSWLDSNPRQLADRQSWKCLIPNCQGTITRAFAVWVTEGVYPGPVPRRRAQ